MERYVCIHGHFYQPPRENPWLRTIELQDSAYPYHDWNERVTTECYAPNTASRILDGEGRIVKIVNNYARMSFNFGPTLLLWLQEKAPDVYEAVLAADRMSQERFGGHGSALAQAYNHMIMPLANRRDKYTQVLWGIRDFEHRFGRSPEGMWLPETAVDLETLDIMAELGIQFTILAPHQASRVRRIGRRGWRDLSDGRIDPTRAYMCRLPSGRRMSLFFYDDPIARAVAFEELLTRGEQFANRLAAAFSDERSWPQLVNIATDGETYGHHRPHGDMALAFALDYIESNNLARLTNYGQYLESSPPVHEVVIVENSSWSCAHGVERWRSDCGCNTGGHSEWNQAWRAPLREALDWLRDSLASRYEETGRELLREPWAARDDYVNVILDRSPENVSRFLAEHSARPLDEAEEITVLKLLELQHHAMLMYASCGWFFDELSGIEAVQVIQYAGRAIQLAEELWNDDTESDFLERLQMAKSNIAWYRDGRRIYERSVKPTKVDLSQVVAHYAVSSLFEPYGESTNIHCYTVNRDDYRKVEVGETRLVVGRVRVTSEITRESALLSFGVLHFGDHNLNGGVRAFRGQRAYQTMVDEVTDAFSRGDLPEVIRLLDKHFLELTYSLKSLFRDEQRRVINMILASTLAEAEAAYRQTYEHHAPLMHFLADIRVPIPRELCSAAEAMMNADVRRAFQLETPDLDRVRSLFEETATWGLELDVQGIAYTINQTIGRLAERFRAQPGDPIALETLEGAVGLAHTLPFEVDLWKAQNAYYEVLHSAYPESRARADEGDEIARDWAGRFVALGDQLSVRVE